MKKIASIILSMVIAATMLTGCGNAEQTKQLIQAAAGVAEECIDAGYFHYEELPDIGSEVTPTESQAETDGNTDTATVDTCMDADTIYINGNIYTVDDSYPWAEAMAVKDGKLVYVGNNEGALEFSGDKVDLKGKFVMPGIIDSHTHIAWSSQALIAGEAAMLEGDSKADIINGIRIHIEADPEKENYRFVMAGSSLNGESLTRDELDELSPDKPLLIVEVEQHSRWVNTAEMKVENISEDAPDIVDGLSYFERDEDGRINGRIYEWCGMAETYKDFPKEVYENGFDRIAEKWLEWGVIAAYDAGQQANDSSISNFFNVLTERDENGELPFYIQGCYYIYNPKQLDNAISELKRYNEEYTSEHVGNHIMKIMMDGTMNGRTAALYENYADTDSNGATLLDVDTLTEFIKELNDAGYDLHVHTVGDRAVGTVLDAVENARNDLGDEYRINVTCAHVEALDPKDTGRFAELGVTVNFTPSWFSGFCYGSIDVPVAYKTVAGILGDERASVTYRANTVWNTGALTTFSSDCISMQMLGAWSPYVGIETGITRLHPSDEPKTSAGMPNSSDKLSLDKMIKGYTINGAIQMGLDDKIGSIETGKDASFLVFEKSLFDVNVNKLHNQLPEAVYIRGELVTEKSDTAENNNKKIITKN